MDSFNSTHASVSRFAGGHVTIAMGGHGFRTLIASLDGTQPHDFFGNVLYVDTDAQEVETQSGRRFVELGGTFFPLSTSQIGSWTESALEGRNSSEYAPVVRQIWSNYEQEALHRMLRHVQECHGSSAVRTVTATAVYALAGALLNRINAKVSAAKKNAKNPSAPVRVILLGSITGAAGSGGMTSLAWILLSKLKGIDVAVHVAVHDVNSIIGFSSEAKCDLMRGNAFQALNELQRLSEQEFLNSRLVGVEIFDGVFNSLGDADLTSAHARLLTARYSLGIAALEKSRSINNTAVTPERGVITVVGAAAEYGAHQGLMPFGMARIESRILQKLLAASDRMALDTLAQSPTVPEDLLPPDRTASLATSPTLESAVSSAQRIDQELTTFAGNQAASSDTIAARERARIVTDGERMILENIYNGLPSAGEALTLVRRRTEAALSKSRQEIEELGISVDRAHAGIDTPPRSIGQRVRQLPRLQQAAILCGLATSVALLTAGELAMLLGALTLIVTAAALAYLLKGDKVSTTDAIRILAQRLNARRATILAAHSSAVFVGRLAGIDELKDRVELTRKAIEARAAALRSSLEDGVESPRYGSIAIQRSDEFQAATENWLCEERISFSELEGTSICTDINRASAEAAKRLLRNITIGTLSKSKLDQVIKEVGALTAITVKHKADPMTLPPAQTWVTTDSGAVDEGEDKLAKALQHAETHRIYVLRQQSGLRLEDLPMAIDLGSALERVSVPTATLPPAARPKSVQQPANEVLPSRSQTNAKV
jgi:hypothetical protein